MTLMKSRKPSIILNTTKVFQQSYLNHQQKINAPKYDTADINDISEIENYEKIYLDSFQAHKLKE